MFQITRLIIIDVGYRVLVTCTGDQHGGVDYQSAELLKGDPEARN